ncbi:MAG: exodeoxyribonuclease V subunit alpha [Burkholderiales bacterium]|jgi:exodeoxyribonuclease V alpha subunit|nr:exodeoxyribonuclease V subunit alpha [Burkholderiales bacterium]
MLNNSQLPITTQLLTLANPMSEAQSTQLAKIIDALFNDLDEGHSCSLVMDLALRLECDAIEINECLLASGLCALYQNKIISEYDSKPFSIVNTDSASLVYISKYLNYEQSIVAKVKQLMTMPETDNVGVSYQQGLQQLQTLSTAENRPNSEQLAAIIAASCQKFSIITGGPGTGKTTTVTLLLWLLYQTYGADLKVQICAPTGKAAIRVRDSVSNTLRSLEQSSLIDFDSNLFAGLLREGNNFLTIHKLLGYQHNSIYFKHNAHNQLDLDVLIIDESSMISLPLFSKLFQALNLDKLKHIIFLGDKNQLSSVEEGYVFASLVALHNDTSNNNDVYDLFTQIQEPNITHELLISNRNQGIIHELAQAILTQNESALTSCLESSEQVEVFAPELKLVLQHVLGDAHSTFRQFLSFAQNANNEHDSAELFRLFSAQTILCLTNGGVLGCDNLNTRLELQIKRILGVNDEWYNGRAIIILQNDYNLELFNGDIGICVLKDDRARVVFESGREFIPEVLPNYTLAYAITIHKSQGSEYQQVSIVLPTQQSADASAGRLLSRELLYTAVTRAKSNIRLYCEQETLLAAIKQQTVRNSGLAIFLTA